MLLYIIILYIHKLHTFILILLKDYVSLRINNRFFKGLKVEVNITAGLNTLSVSINFVRQKNVLNVLASRRSRCRSSVVTRIDWITEELLNVILLLQYVFINMSLVIVLYQNTYVTFIVVSY